MNLENVLSEISQIQKDTYCMIPFIFHLYTWNRQIYRDRKDNSGFQRLEEGRNTELLFNKHRVSVWKDVKVLERDGGDGCTTV